MYIYVEKTTNKSDGLKKKCMPLDDKNANKKNGHRFVSSRLYYCLNKSHSKREACVAGAKN